jgi:transcriptional regulator with XRE-family HTH domain
MEFGAYLKCLRQHAALTQIELARKCGLSDAYVNQLETARTDPPTRQVCRTLARALEANEDELWKHAFTARLERWLKKEGFRRIQADSLTAFFDILNKRN